MGEMLKAKIDRLAGKIYLVPNSFSPKKHLKVTFSRPKKSALAHFGGQAVDTRSTFGVSLKT